MKAKIFKPAKNAMQSGRGHATQWLLEYELETARRPEPLMGWTSSRDTLNQVRLKFESKEAAVAFAESRGFDFTIGEDHTRIVKPRSYLDNFKYRPFEEEK
ncbi:MAG: ETC complex I subunit [Micavibrio sp.]|nr:ETC complex I subunit [Micavibrio sp.]